MLLPPYPLPCNPSRGPHVPPRDTSSFFTALLPPSSPGHAPSSASTSIQGNVLPSESCVFSPRTLSGTLHKPTPRPHPGPGHSPGLLFLDPSVPILPAPCSLSLSVFRLSPQGPDSLSSVFTSSASDGCQGPRLQPLGAARPFQPDWHKPCFGETQSRMHLLST